MYMSHLNMSIAINTMIISTIYYTNISYKVLIVMI